MASEHPKPDRCGASVIDKVGIEIHSETFSTDADLDVDDLAEYDDEDRPVLTDEQLRSVIVTDGDVEEALEPEYVTVVDYLRSGFDTKAVRLLDPDATLVVEDDDPYVTNARTELEGYCERYPMDNGRCYVHGGNATGAPEGNTNAMKHGLKARRSNYYEQLDDEEKAFVEAMVDSWLEDAPFDRGNAAKVTEIYRIAIDQHRLWNATDEYVEDGITTEEVLTDDTGSPVYDENGDPVTKEVENPANLPYSRLDRDLFKKLKELGCLDDPDSQDAEAKESLAQKLSGLSED